MNINQLYNTAIEFHKKGNLAEASQQNMISNILKAELTSKKFWTVFPLRPRQIHEQVKVTKMVEPLAIAVRR